MGPSCSAVRDANYGKPRALSASLFDMLAIEILSDWRTYMSQIPQSKALRSDPATRHGEQAM